MRTHRSASFVMAGLLLLSLGIGLFGSTGYVYAADRTVVGELWSSDG